MAVIWCGNEDVDFYPNPLDIVTTGTRTDYVRYGVTLDQQIVSNRFQELTDCWCSVRFWASSTGSGAPFLQIRDYDSGNNIQLCKSSHNLLLRKNTTTLVDSGDIQLSDGNQKKIDLQLINYGATATVNVFVNGVKVIEYTGDVSFAGITGFNCIATRPSSSSSSFGVSRGVTSEFIVATEDTRNMSLKTLAPVAAGDVNEWVGDHTDINEDIANENTYIHTEELDKLFNASLSGMPAVAKVYTVKAVKLTCRTGQSTAGGIQFGVKTNGVNYFGTTKDPTIEDTFEEFFHTNPETGIDWTPEDIDNLQLSIRSVTL